MADTETPPALETKDLPYAAVPAPVPAPDRTYGEDDDESSAEPEANDTATEQKPRRAKAGEAKG